VALGHQDLNLVMVSWCHSRRHPWNPEVAPSSHHHYLRFQYDDFDGLPDIIISDGAGELLQ
jgi:hypothetical protein